MIDMLIESPWYIVMHNKIPKVKDELIEKMVKFIFKKFKVLKMDTTLIYADGTEETFIEELDSIETYRNLIAKYKEKLRERWPFYGPRLIYFLFPAKWYVNLDFKRNEVEEAPYEVHFSLGPRTLRIGPISEKYCSTENVRELAYENTKHIINFSRELLFELDFVPVITADSVFSEQGPLICAGGYPWFFVPVDDKRLVVKAIPKEYDLHEKLYYAFKEQIPAEVIVDVLKENCISWEEKEGKYFFVFAKAVDDVKYNFQKDIFPKLREATKDIVEKIKKEAKE